jgi:FkbM family methyltransferase
MRSTVRRLFQHSSQELCKLWGHSRIAPGWCVQVVDRVHNLFDERLQPARLRENLRMNCDLRDHVQRRIFFFGLYEPAESYVVSKLLKPGMTFIDAGANVGQYTLLAARAVGPSGKVIAFEPVPSNYERVCRHVSENGLNNVSVKRNALWHESTPLSLGLHRTMSDNQGAFSVAEGGSSSAFIVDAITLDDFVMEAGIARVDFIKMDIEGAELFALRGMLKTLDRDGPTLLVEIRDDTFVRMGYDPMALWSEVFAPRGYSAWVIGQSAQDSYPVRDLRDVRQANVIFHRGNALPPELLNGWTLKSVLQWAQE